MATTDGGSVMTNEAMTGAAARKATTPVRVVAFDAAFAKLDNSTKGAKP